MYINGQLKPSAATLSTLYTATGETVISSIVVCNLDAAATTFRIAVRPLGAAINDKHYLYYDVPVNGNDTFVATIGITLANTDVISCYATLATVSFSAFGSQK
jgi:hypothetical protein